MDRLRTCSSGNKERVMTDPTSHSTALLGTLTIGQAPRADITPILNAALPPGARTLHAGVLDGLSLEQIQARYCPRPGEPMLVTRLLDGSSVRLDKAAIRETLIARLRKLEEQGCTVILILCTGEFHGLSSSRAWLIEPDRIVPPAVAAIAGQRQVGILVPLPEQALTEAGKFSALAKPPICAAASPYEAGMDHVREAAIALRDRGADVLLMDCMGFVEAHRNAAREASGLPVLLSNALMAKLTAELVS
jgi:protein AroM